jgi:hypothetical protein
MTKDIVHSSTNVFVDLGTRAGIRVPIKTAA